MDSRWKSALAEFRSAFEREREAAAREQPEWMLARLDYYTSHQFPADPIADVEAFESAIGMSVPPSLRTLWSEHGAFSVFTPEVWDSLRLCSAADLLIERKSRPHWPSVYEGLCHFGNRNEFESSLTPAEVDSLRSAIFFFGRIVRSDSDFDLLVFDRAGRFGCVRYNHDWADFNGEAWRAEYSALVLGQLRTIDLDSFLTEHIMAARTKMERWNTA